jgi:hypothetical protein
VSAADSAGGHRPTLRVVHGDATPEEIAALVAVLAAAGGGDDESGGSRGSGARRSRWADPASRVRPAVAHGPGAWRTSALPH